MQYKKKVGKKAEGGLWDKAAQGAKCESGS